MLNSYFGVFALMLLAAFGFLIPILSLASFLGPKRYTEMKDDPFECGTVATGSANERFGVKFYLVAMVFILFDMEIVFLYPWALQAVQLGVSGLVAMVSFMVILSLGLVYVWRRGVLDWL